MKAIMTSRKKLQFIRKDSPHPDGLHQLPAGSNRFINVSSSTIIPGQGTIITSRLRNCLNMSTHQNSV